MKRITRTLCVLLSAVMLLGALSACGGESGTTETPAPEFVYVASYAKLQSDQIQGFSGNACWYDGRIYFVASIEDGTETYEYPTGELDENGNPVMVTEEYPSYRSALYSCADDGTDAKELPGYTPKEAPKDENGNSTGGSYINGMTVDTKGNIWICEGVYSQTFDLPEGMDQNDPEAYNYYTYKEEYFVRAYDMSGAEVANLDLSAIESDNEYGISVNSLAVTTDGNICIYDGNGSSVHVLDSTGKKLFSLSQENGWIGNLVRLADGSVAAMVSSNDGKSSFKAVDVATKGWKDLGDVPVNAWNFITGGGDYDLYYNTDTSLFGYKLSTGESTKLVTWINADVDSGTLNSIMPLPDGRVICTSYGSDGSSDSAELVTLTKTPSSEVAQKTVLSYACMWLDYNVRSQIIKFNKTNPTYRIEVRDYSEYNTGDDYNAGLTKLATEMISGNVPDIIAVDNLPFSQYATKGLFEDLWPFIDADTELGGRDALVMPVFEALSTGDKLYRMCSSFSVQTAYGLSSVVGDQPGWTLEQLLAAYETMPEGATIFRRGYTKDSILSSICYMYLDDLVDWDAGKCYFDGELFSSLLGLTEYFPSTYDYNSENEPSVYDPSGEMKRGEMLLNQFYLYSFGDYYWDLGADLTPYTFIGYPTADGSVGSAFSVQQSMAMSSKCEHKDGAWEFMRYFLTKDFAEQNMWQFSANKSVLDKMLKDAMTPEYYTDENGNRVEQPKMTYMNNDGEEVQVYAMDQPTADKLMSIINDTTRIYSYDEKIYNIVAEECAAFFAGQKSAQDTAKMIQSKVSLYVSEQS